MELLFQSNQQQNASNNAPDFIAFVTGAEVEAVVQKVIDQHWPKGIVIHGGIQSAMSANPSVSGMPQYVVVDVTGDESAIPDIEHVARVFRGVKVLLVIGERNDVRFYREVTHAGGDDYLVKPFSADDLYNALLEASSNKMQAMAPSIGNFASAGGGSGGATTKARLITLLGAHGGVGTSMVCANAAYIMAEEFGQRTAIMDMDVHFGTIALSLDVEPSIGFRDALESPSRIDNLFVEGALVSVTERLSVLATEESLDSYISYDRNAIDLLLEKLRDNREYVFVDAPRSTVMNAAQVITDADTILIVSDLTVAGLRDTVTLLNKIRSLSTIKEVKIVINKDRPKKIGQISIKDFEKEVDMPVSVILPDEPEVVASAMNDGKPVMAKSRSSKVTQGLINLCQSIHGDIGIKAPKKSLINQILRSFK